MSDLCYFFISIYFPIVTNKHEHLLWSWFYLDTELRDTVLFWPTYISIINADIEYNIIASFLQ